MSQSDNTLDIRGSEVAAAPRYDSTDSSLAEKHYAKEGFSDERFTAQDGAGAVPGDSLAEKLTFKHDLHRGLKSRQIAMIAIGGAIGTGLIIGTGAGLVRAGPAGILISYCLVGFIIYMVMTALGEMSSYLPLPEGFIATRFVDPALGFALGWTYWLKYVVTTPNQLTAAALVIQYWLPREKVNPGVWITVFLLLIVCINYFGIKFFGEFEFWLSSIKVCVIVGLIILCLILALGGGPTHDRLGFRYWNDPGAFNTYIADGDKGRFLAVWSVMVIAVFAFMGSELVGVTVGEAQNPRKNIPRAIRLVFWLLQQLVLSVFLLGMILPYNSTELVFATNARTGAAASPFVVAIVNAQIPVLPGFLNACILLFVISAANSDLYIASRTLYALALGGAAPSFIARTDKRGVPIVALGLSALLCSLAYMNVATESATVFKYFVNLVTIFGLLVWISILVAHIGFIKCVEAQGVDRKRDLPYYSPLGAFGSWFALFFCILIAIFKISSPSYKIADIRLRFNTANFVTSYLGIPLYLIFIFGFKIIKKSKRVIPATADLITGKERIDKDEAEFLAAQERNPPKNGVPFSHVENR